MTAGDHETEIMIARMLDDDGVECVKLSTFLDDDQEGEIYYEKVLKFPESGYAECYVDDFSQESAEYFLEQAVDEQRQQP